MSERDWQRDWELAMQTTPGPWKIKKAKVCDYSSGKEHLATVSIGPLEIDASADDFCVCIDAWLDINEDDAYFIAEAREALLYWLQRVKELERAIINFVEARELAERTGVWVVMTPVMWDAFEELRKKVIKTK